MSPVSVSAINVALDFGESPISLGRLAIRDRKIYFEYDAEFVERQLNVSPFRLPLQPGLHTFEGNLFEGLPGVFNDSLPDGWGRLLFDRAMRARDIKIENLSPLDRLAHVGRSGMGALTYKPDFSVTGTKGTLHLDSLAAHAKDVLEGEAGDVLQELLALNGSSAGARPKALIGFNQESGRIVHGTDIVADDYEYWLVKFAQFQDGLDSGAIEYVYAKMAVNAGLELAPANLFPAKRGAGYFATKRFDRVDGERLHMHTACGLLHSDFRQPSLDYQDLLELTTALTRDVRETEKMYRIAVFNVLAHNRDDHSKNFSFLMDTRGEWKLSPAYDLTFSMGPGGEQSTMVMGVGKSPQIPELRKLGESAAMKKQRINEIIERTVESLSTWPKLARTYGVTANNVRLINKHIGKSRQSKK